MCALKDTIIEEQDTGVNVYGNKTEIINEIPLREIEDEHDDPEWDNQFEK